MPTDDGEFILDTDALDTTIGAVSSQKQGEHERVVAYASRRLDRRESRYCVTRKELLAVVYFCLLYTSPSPRDRTRSRMPSSA